jgi:hypothetical protein
MYDVNQLLMGESKLEPRRIKGANSRFIVLYSLLKIRIEFFLVLVLYKYDQVGFIASVPVKLHKF